MYSNRVFNFILITIAISCVHALTTFGRSNAKKAESDSYVDDVSPTFTTSGPVIMGYFEDKLHSMKDVNTVEATLSAVKGHYENELKKCEVREGKLMVLLEKVILKPKDMNPACTISVYNTPSDKVLVNRGDILEDGKAYFLKSVDGKFIVVDERKQLGFAKNIPMMYAAKFVASRKSYNVFGLCVEGYCMARCEGCQPDTNDHQSVKFHAQNSDKDFTQWTIEGDNKACVGPYTLKTDGENGYLTLKKTANNDDQLTLGRDQSTVTKFEFILA